MSLLHLFFFSLEVALGEQVIFSTVAILPFCWGRSLVPGWRTGSMEAGGMKVAQSRVGGVLPIHLLLCQNGSKMECVVAGVMAGAA